MHCRSPSDELGFVLNMGTELALLLLQLAASQLKGPSVRLVGRACQCCSIMPQNNNIYIYIHAWVASHKELRCQAALTPSHINHRYTSTHRCPWTPPSPTPSPRASAPAPPPASRCCGCGRRPSARWRRLLFLSLPRPGRSRWRRSSRLCQGPTTCRCVCIGGGSYVDLYQISSLCSASLPCAAGMHRTLHNINPLHAHTHTRILHMRSPSLSLASRPLALW